MMELLVEEQVIQLVGARPSNLFIIVTTIDKNTWLKVLRTQTLSALITGTNMH